MHGSTWARQSQRSVIEDNKDSKSIQQVSGSAHPDGKPEDGRQKAWIASPVSSIMRRLSRRHLGQSSSSSYSSPVTPFIGGQATEASDEAQNTTAPPRQAAW